MRYVRYTDGVRVPVLAARYDRRTTTTSVLTDCPGRDGCVVHEVKGGRYRGAYEALPTAVPKTLAVPVGAVIYRGQVGGELVRADPAAVPDFGPVDPRF